MDDITIGVNEYVNNILVTAQPNDQIIDITVTETVETVLLDVSTSVSEVSVTATQNVIVENITIDYVNNENQIDINVTDATQDVTLNVTPTLIEINVLRSGGEVNILQFDSLADFPSTGSSDYFYLAKDTNKLYRWTGSAYAEISATANAIWGEITGTLSEQTDLQNALNLKAPINSPTFTGTVSGITKTMVGLGAVDNTSDLDKPISTATQTALNAKQPLDGDLTSIAGLTGTAGFLKKNGANSWNLDNTTYLSSISSSDVTTALGYTPEDAANKGVNGGYASLDGSGKVPSSQLPSYVDDVIEVANYGSLPSTGETGKIYITLDTNKIYRWSGSVYVEVSSSSSVWGAITGTLSNQTDLQSALDAKQDDLNGTGFVKASGTTISYDNTTYYPASNPNGYTSNTGTVTSVALSVPSAFSVSGSPITSSGTLAISATGDTTQYIAGDGSLVTFPTSSTAGTLIREVRNTSGATITKGTVVYISGATGNKPTISKAIATGDSTSAQTFGLVQADIANNANGNVVCVGDLTGIDTSALTEGAQLYLSSTTAGAYTTTKQYAPAHLVYIGIVTRAHPTLGQIEVKIQNGYELDELHNVSAQTPSNNDGLFYESSTSLWKNKSIATVLGYTPANGSDYMALSGDQNIAGNKTFTGFAYFDNTIFLKQTTSISFISGYNSIAASSSGIRMGITSGISALFNLTSLSTNRDYTLPNASGTIALTSDIPSLSGYVDTTTNQSIGGTKTFTSQLHGAQLRFSESGGFGQVAGYTQIGGTADYFNFVNGNNTKQATFTYGTGGSGYTYTLPNSNGTLALTSALSSYLPLAGGTMTGAIVGTTATFTNSGSGIGLGVTLSGASGDGIKITHSAGRAFNIQSSGSGYGILINNATASTSAPFTIQKQGADKITFTDAGAGTFVSTISAAGATLTGALSGTSATFSTTIADYAMSVSNVLDSSQGLLVRATDNDGDLYLLKLQSSNGATSQTWVDRFTVAKNGAATFSSSVTASGTISTTAGYGILSGGGGYAIGPSSTRGIIALNGSGDQILTFNTESYIYNNPSLFRMLSSSDIDFVSGGTQRLIIKNTGNVGIGTTSPSNRLSVFESTGTTTSTMDFTTTGNAIKGHIGMFANNFYITSNWFYNGSQNADNTGYAQNAISFDNAGFMNFQTSAAGATSPTERMRITSAGGVGINTTPDSGFKLHVNGYVKFNDASGVQLSSGSQYRQIYFDGFNTLYFWNGSNQSNLSSAGAWVNASDQSIKKDVIDIKYGLSDLMLLNPRSYKMKTDDLEQIGFIAQEVEQVIPEVVNSDNKGMKGLSYGNMVALLTKSIQELKAELDTLKNK